jgi:hypothetical protein
MVRLDELAGMPCFHFERNAAPRLDRQSMPERDFGYGLPVQSGGGITALPVRPSHFDMLFGIEGVVGRPARDAKASNLIAGVQWVRTFITMK